MMENLQQKTILFIRDIIISVAIVGIIIAALWAYTGQFPHTPMVVVTSESMMHQNSPFGKIGTIDPGDLVLVKKIYSKNDIITRGNESHPMTKHRTYGDYGDVIIYYPMGNKKRVPIIHRAICWIQKNSDGTYDVKEFGIHHAKEITIPELHLYNYRPQHGGFITKGDNNEYPDQLPNGGICPQPIEPTWIIGKARGELPWFGLIKLMIYGNGNGYQGNDAVRIGKAVAPKDEWICLGISLFVIIVLPSIWDAYNFFKSRKSKELRL